MKHDPKATNKLNHCKFKDNLSITFDCGLNHTRPKKTTQYERSCYELPKLR